MRISSSRVALALLATAAVVFGACSSSGSSSAPSSGASAGPLKVGLVTDVGTLEDKSFNEASWLAVQDAKAKLGAEIDNIVTKAPTDYQVNMKAFADRGFNVIVTSGFALGNDTTIAAGLYPNIKFIGTDQSVCVTKDKKPDPTFKCEGDAATLLPNYQGLIYKEAQAGYLAGIIAASVSKSHVIGALGGINTIPPVVSYVRGYQNGAKATDPNVNVLLTYSSTDIAKAFNDPATGKSIGQQMVGQKADVLFQVAGLTGQGFLEAGCGAGAWGIGVDVDQWQSLPTLQKCIVTSAEKKLRASVFAAIQRIKDGSAKGATIVNDAASDPVGIGVSDYHNHKDLITPDIQKKVDDALAAMKAGTLDPCKPQACTP
jgi:basic membrane protein A and related proteins